MTPYVLAFWTGCALAAHGFSFAYLQGHAPKTAKYEYYKDMKLSAIISLCFGPVALWTFFYVFRTVKYGFKMF